MAEFNYMNEAGLYIGKTLRSTRGPRYRRFETAAEAVRFAMEEMPSSQLRGCVMEVNEARFDERQIRTLYAAAAYPLLRKDK